MKFFNFIKNKILSKNSTKVPEDISILFNDLYFYIENFKLIFPSVTVRFRELLKSKYSKFHYEFNLYWNQQILLKYNDKIIFVVPFYFKKKKIIIKKFIPLSDIKDYTPFLLPLFDLKNIIEEEEEKLQIEYKNSIEEYKSLVK